MRLEVIVFLLGLGFIILFFPVRIKAEVAYSIFSNKGYLSLFLFKPKVFICRYKIKNFKLFVETKKKNFEIDLLNEKNQTSFGEIYLSQIIKKIRIKNLRLISRFGFNGDMMVSCLGGASIKILFSIFLGIICEKKKIDNYEIKSYVTDSTSFLNVLTSSVQFNLFILILGLVKTIILKFKKGLVKKYGN